MMKKYIAIVIIVALWILAMWLPPHVRADGFLGGAGGGTASAPSGTGAIADNNSTFSLITGTTCIMGFNSSGVYGCYTNLAVSIMSDTTGTKFVTYNFASMSAGTYTIAMPATAGTYTFGGSAFSAITSGTNTLASMVVGTGAYIGTSGTGTIGGNVVMTSGTISTTGTSTIQGTVFSTGGSAGTSTISGGTLSTSVSVSTVSLYTSGVATHQSIVSLSSTSTVNLYSSGVTTFAGNPKFSTSATGTQTLTTNTTTTIINLTVNTDSASGYSTTNGRYTVTSTAAGYYHFDFGALLTATTITQVDFYLVTAATTTIQPPCHINPLATSTTLGYFCSWDTVAAAGDVFFIKANVLTTGTTTITSGRFGGFYVP